MLAEGHGRKSRIHHGGASLDDSSMVQQSSGTVDRTPTNLATTGGSTVSCTLQRMSSIEEIHCDDGMSIVGRHFKDSGFSSDASDVLLASWRGSTKKQYKTFHKKWVSFCCERKIDQSQISVNHVIEFLTMLYHNNLGYSALNTARASLSALGFVIDGHAIGSHPIIIRFMKGFFNLRPPTPRHDFVWDVTIVLSFLRKLSPVKYLSLKDLTCKLCMLICLTCAARVYTIHALKLSCMQKKTSSFVLNFDSLLKTCRPGFRRPNIVLKAYPADRRLCVYTLLVEYLKRTSHLRSENDDALFISYVRPHNAASKDTLSRWIRYIMMRSGIDIRVFVRQQFQRLILTLCLFMIF